MLTGAVVVDPVIGVVKADIGIKDGRIAGIGRAGSPAISDGIDLVVGPHTKSYSAYGSDRHARRRRLARPHDRPGAAPARPLGRRHDVHHRGVRGAAVRDGTGPRRARGVADQHRHAGGGEGDRRGPPRRAGRGRRDRLQDPRGQRRVPGAHRRRPALRGRPRPLGLAPHRRAARGVGARGHRLGHRRADRPRLPRRGLRGRARAGPPGPGPGAVDHLLLDHADAPVRGQHRRSRTSR